ncbi:hypothetical protein Tco_1254419 [Tanacetum coccineum]
MSFDPFLLLFVEVKKDDRRIVERKKSTMPRLPLDVCSPSFGAPRDRSYEIIATKLKVVPKVDDVSLVNGVFDGAFGGDGEEDVVMGEGVVVTYSSLEMLTKSCLGGMMVSLIFLKRLEEEAYVEAMEERYEGDEDDNKNGEDEYLI